MDLINYYINKHNYEGYSIYELEEKISKYKSLIIKYQLLNRTLYLHNNILYDIKNNKKYLLINNKIIDYTYEPFFKYKLIIIEYLLNNRIEMKVIDKGRQLIYYKNKIIKEIINGESNILLQIFYNNIKIYFKLILKYNLIKFLLVNKNKSNFGKFNDIKIRYYIFNYKKFIFVSTKN